MNGRTPGPWMVAGVRGKLERQAVHNIVRYDAEKKRDENIASVWYDEKTGLGFADAHLIAAAPTLLAALESLLDELLCVRDYVDDASRGGLLYRGKADISAMAGEDLVRIDAAIFAARAAIARAKGGAA